MYIYDSQYNTSWAICIGINCYKNASPLQFAVNDAEEVAKILISNFSFPDENVKILTDEYATKTNILKTFCELVNQTDVNDRVFFFFAGHGHTVSGNRGEVGYLIPYDALPNDISTMIRWDEISKNSELMPAKHMLFVLDACFSGLAITRSFSNGNMRFVKDMLNRYSRQVLAAGKANQPVSDGNGPIPNHSIFTGHLINGLKGEAKTFKEILSANGLMYYVYQKVANDTNSFQTPHYGFFDGDGDFIFEYPCADKNDNKKGEDILFEIPGLIQSTQTYEPSFLEKLKIYLSESKHFIKLDDLITTELKKSISLLNETNFPSSDSSKEEIIRGHIDKIESILGNLQIILVAVSNWGNEDQKNLYFKIFSRLISHISNENEKFLWKSLRWYSIIWLMYSTGITLLLKNDFRTLYKLLSSQMDLYSYDQKDITLLSSYCYAYADIISSETIRKIKVHERHFAPLSEFLFTKLQSVLEDILYVGTEYELIFDKYEVLIGLQSAYTHYKLYNRCWAPTGRFGWKYYGRSGKNNPVDLLITVAKSQQVEWLPLKAGFFDNNYENFVNASEKFEDYLKSLNWY